MIVWLARHGEAASAHGRALGSSDPPLSDRGRLQAMGLAGRLASRPLEAVYASDLRRALAAAEAVAAPHGLSVAVIPALRELDFGTWEGRELADLWLEHPDQAKAWEEDVRQSPAAFAESVTQLEARVRPFARDLAAGRWVEVAVVAHRGSLVALHAALLHGDFASSFRLLFELGEAIRIEFDSCSR
jgi:broad specificity phosphatase PhoE